MLFGIMAPGKGQFHAVYVGGGSQSPDSGDGSGLFLSLPRRELWGVPGRNDTTNSGGKIPADQTTNMGGGDFYLHLGPGLAETDKFLSLATWPLVISAETMGRVGMIGSPFVITHNKIS